jgi:hypothetical protein
VERQGGRGLRETVKSSNGGTKGSAFPRERSLLLSALAVAAILAGCGSSAGNGGAATESATAPTGVVPSRDAERAEEICTRALRETHALGRRLSRVVANSPSPEAGVTNGVVKPGIEILEREGEGLRSIDSPSDSPAWQLFVGLLDPIVALAHQRLQATGAGEPELARGLETMIARLDAERSAAARQLGLATCDVPFTSALGGRG